MTNINTIKVKINDSVLPGRSPGLFLCVLFSCCFVFGFAIYIWLQGKLHLPETYDDLAAWFILVSSVLIVVVFCMLRSRKRSLDAEMIANLLDDTMKIQVGNKCWTIPYADIKEISKRMIIDRGYQEKGHYRVKVKRHHHLSLVFETTEDEYEKRMDFEETELYQFYDACRTRGVKCC